MVTNAIFLMVLLVSILHNGKCDTDGNYGDIGDETEFLIKKSTIPSYANITIDENSKFGNTDDDTETDITSSTEGSTAEDNKVGSETDKEQVKIIKINQFSRFVNPIYYRDFVGLDKYKPKTPLKKKSEIPKLKSRDMMFKPMSDKEVEALNTINKILDPKNAHLIKSTQNKRDNIQHKEFTKQKAVQLARFLRGGSIHNNAQIQNYKHFENIQKENSKKHDIYDIFGYQKYSRSPFTLNLHQRTNRIQDSIPLLSFLHKKTSMPNANSFRNYPYSEGSFRRKNIWKSQNNLLNDKRRESLVLKELANKYKYNTLLRDLSKVTIQWTGYKDPRFTKKELNPKWIDYLKDVMQPKFDDQHHSKLAGIYKSPIVENFKQQQIDEDVQTRLDVTPGSSLNTQKQEVITQTLSKRNHGKLVGYLIKPHSGVRGSHNFKTKVIDIVPSSKKTKQTSGDTKFEFKKVGSIFIDPSKFELQDNLQIPIPHISKQDEQQQNPKQQFMTQLQLQQQQQQQYNQQYEQLQSPILPTFKYPAQQQQQLLQLLKKLKQQEHQHYNGILQPKKHLFKYLPPSAIQVPAPMPILPINLLKTQNNMLHYPVMQQPHPPPQNYPINSHNYGIDHCVPENSLCDKGHDEHCCGASSFCIDYWGVGKCLAFKTLEHSDFTDPYKKRNNINYKSYYNYLLDTVKNEIRNNHYSTPINSILTTTAVNS